MPFYSGIDFESAEGQRIAESLVRLQEALAVIPPKTVDKTLLLATWNIREFESSKYGNRTDEAIFYMAEIISRFDLVAVQEVRDDLSGLKRLLKVLGGYWKFIMTDVTQGTQGNRERLCFLYDSRKVSHTGLAGEIVLPPEKNKPSLQIVRTPYLVGFKAGWTRFNLATVHILYGAAKANDARRVAEIEKVAKFIAKLAKDKHADTSNWVLLGDFNIFKPTDATFKAMADQGFVVPDPLKNTATNVVGSKTYDQIAFRYDPNRLTFTGEGGIFRFFNHVFRDQDEATHTSQMGEKYRAKDTAKKKTSYYGIWRTFQMSDHVPMWLELKIDYSTEYLKRHASRGNNSPRVVI